MRVVIVGNGITVNTAASKVHRLNASSEIVIISEESRLLCSPCVVPHYVGEEITQGRVFIRKAKTSWILGAVLPLSSPTSSYVTGSVIVVDSGFLS
jgi:NAD(P)-dependent dehydrogenase (short-subunit alcohol dehydrogenase family)